MRNLTLWHSLQQRQECHKQWNLRWLTKKQRVTYTTPLLLNTLALSVDNHLKWEKHIKHLNGKLRKLIYKFYNLKSVLNRKTLLVTYNSVAESIIRYGISVWGAAYNTTLQSLQITQNYILRTIFNKKSRDSCRNIFIENEILYVKGLYMHSCYSL